MIKNLAFALICNSTFSAAFASDVQVRCNSENDSSLFFNLTIGKKQRDTRTSCSFYQGTANELHKRNEVVAPYSVEVMEQKIVTRTHSGTKYSYFTAYGDFVNLKEINFAESGFENELSFVGTLTHSSNSRIGLRCQRE